MSNATAETIEQAAQEMFDRGSYKNNSQLQSAYFIGAKFGADWQLRQIVDLLTTNQQLRERVKELEGALSTSLKELITLVPVTDINVIRLAKAALEGGREG